MGEVIESIPGPSGREVPIEWVFSDARECAWVRDEEHWKNPLTPMEQWFYRAGQPGTDRAWDEVGSPPPLVFRSWQFAGPYVYYLGDDDPPERLAAIERGFQRLRARHATPARFWHDYCEPRIRDVAVALAATPEDAPLGPVAETWAYGWAQTFTSFIALYVEGLALQALLTELFGPEEAGHLAFEVTQGGENASQAVDLEVHELATAAREVATIADTIASRPPADALTQLRNDEAAAGFMAKFDGLVSSHRSRSEGWDFERPTWGERPEMVLALVRSHLAGGARSPAEAAERSRARREAAVARVHAALPTERHGEFRALLARLDHYVDVRESRAYWQMVITGEARFLLLRRGRRLAAEGRLEDPDDIFFLVPPDFEGTGGSLAGIAARRRADHLAWRTVTPPYQVGTPNPAFAQPVHDGVALKGVAASRGVATGPARIVSGPDDWDRLEPGDVLVCTLTTPAWTPLFALASAVVTESGNAVSHPAITAREYGIPAVLGVPEATTLLRDGEPVTVDGEAGTVTRASG